MFFSDTVQAIHSALNLSFTVTFLPAFSFIYLTASDFSIKLEGHLWVQNLFRILKIVFSFLFENQLCLYCRLKKCHHSLSPSVTLMCHENCNILCVTLLCIKLLLFTSLSFLHRSLFKQPI